MGGTSNPCFKEVRADTVSAVLAQPAIRASGVLAQYRSKADQATRFQQLLEKWDPIPGIWKPGTESVSHT